MATADARGSFGVLLQRHRLAAGLSQEELAERAGLSRRGITDLERGARRTPHPGTLRRLVEALRLAEPERAALVAAARTSRHTTDPVPEEIPAPGRPVVVPLIEDGEQKQATVLCCQLAESTGPTDRSGICSALERMHLLIEKSRQEIARYDGTVSAVLGDGIVALFGFPLAHEDHARRGVLAALGIQRQLDSQLKMRMGIHTGWLAATRITGSHEWTAALGEATTVASGIQQLAQPGCLMVSDATARSIGDLVQLEPAGKTDRSSIHRVVGLKSREGGEQRTSSGIFVGRTTDLALLHDLWTRAEEGEGQVVGIVGEPGIGKSRLVHEFRNSLMPGGAMCLEARCLSYGQTTPYLPIGDLVRGGCGILDADQPAVVSDKVRAGLERAGLVPDEHTRYVLHMLGVAAGPADEASLGPEEVRAGTFDTLKRWVLGASQSQPVIIVVEDLHWIDRTSEEFMTSLVDGLSGSRVLLLSTWRPGYRPPWIEHSYATQLALRPLGANESLSVVKSILQSEQASLSLADPIVQRAEGNPFFVEELARTVRESGGSISSLEVLPDAIQGVLAARIDRLLRAPRKVLQAASVIGREFSLQLLRATWEEATPLEPALRELERLEFIRTRRTARETTFAFKHALTQEAAYASVPARRRRTLHEQIGRTLMEQASDTAQTQPELLAHHFTAAGLDEIALDYWQKAAERAAERSANVEAISHFRTALSILESLPDSDDRARRELGIQIALGAPLIATQGYAATETVRTYARARELADRVGDKTQLFPLLFRNWVTFTIRSQHNDARAAAEEFLNLAEQQPESEPRMMGHRILGVTLLMTGEVAAGLAESRRALSLYDPERHRGNAIRYGQEPRVAILTWTSIGLWLTGDVAEAERVVAEATATATASQHVNTQAFALTYGRCLLESLRGDAVAIEAPLQSLISLADRFHLAMWRAYATMYEGWMVAARGNPAAGVDGLRAGLAALRSVGTEALRPHFLGLLAWSLAANRHTALALDALDEAFEQVQRGGERVWTADLQRIQAEVLRQTHGTGTP